MTTEIIVKTEVSVLFSPEGVDLYVGDAETPAGSYSFEWLTNEFLDAYDPTWSDSKEGLETLASNFEEMAAKIRNATTQA
jgi:hypothetical protein